MTLCSVRLLTGVSTQRVLQSVQPADQEMRGWGEAMIAMERSSVPVRQSSDRSHQA